MKKQKGHVSANLLSQADKFGYLYGKEFKNLKKQRVRAALTERADDENRRLALEYQHIISHIAYLFRAVMFNAMAAFFAQFVESQAILLLIVNIQ